MGKIRDDNLTITGTEKIIQNGNTIVDANAVGNFDTVNVATKLTIPTDPPSIAEAGLIWVGGPIPPSPFSGDRGIFGGGFTSIDYDLIELITITTPSNASTFGNLFLARRNLAATSNGNNDRGVFGGGYASGQTDIIDYVTISNEETAQDFGNLFSARSTLAGTSNGTNERGVFGGGSFNVIDFITINSIGNAQDFGDLWQGRGALSGTSNATNERGIFAGGGILPFAKYNYIDYITINSTGDSQDFGDLTVGRLSLAATSNGTNDRAVFGGGTTGSDIIVIDYITISSGGIAGVFGDLTVARNSLAATSNGTGEVAVFGGGSAESQFSDVLDYFTINSLSNAYEFGNLTLARLGLAATSNE